MGGVCFCKLLGALFAATKSKEASIRGKSKLMRKIAVHGLTHECRDATPSINNTNVIVVGSGAPRARPDRLYTRRMEGSKVPCGGRAENYGPETRTPHVPAPIRRSARRATPEKGWFSDFYGREPSTGLDGCGKPLFPIRGRQRRRSRGGDSRMLAGGPIMGRISLRKAPYDFKGPTKAAMA